MSLRLKLLLLICISAAFLSFAVPCSNGETFRNPRRIPLSVDPYGLTTGDLNGDGRNDIVWIDRPVYPGTPLLHVLLAGAGGQYTSAPDLSLPFYPSYIQCLIEDVTGDKRNDLVCAAVDATSQVFLFTYIGHGDGTFSTPVQTSLPSTYSNPVIGHAGDLNGDGLSDVTVGTAYYSAILPALSDGHGGFKIGTAFQGSFNISVPTMTDVNGDGKLDAVWPTGPRVDLGNGDGTFSPNVGYDPGYDSNCAFGDVDHDGHLDAACTWYDNGDIDGRMHLTVLHGNSDGSFSKTPLFTRIFGDEENEYDGIPEIISPVFITDLNGDGNADIVAFSGDGYCVLLGGPNSSWNGPPQQFVTASLQSEGALFGIYGVSIADMNGDGIPDITAIGPNGIYITYGQKDGTLSSAPAPELGEISTSVTLVDVNGDGNLDAVSAGDTALKLSLGHGDGTFGSPQPITTSGNFGNALYAAGRVVSGDFNGDGKQDLLATGNIAVSTTQNYILFGHGDGAFDAPKAISISLGKVLDLNNDGLSDVASITNNSTGSANTLNVSLSRGDGTFTSVTTNLPVEISNNFVVPSAGPAFADFRHSGRLDLVVASLSNAYVLHSHGDGTFDSSGAALALPNLPSLTKVSTNDIATGDFDADGNADVAVLVQYGNGIYNLSTPTSAVWVFYGKGDGSFSSAVLAGTFNRNAQTLGAGDLNGDDLADLVLTSYSVYQDNGVLIVHSLPNRAWGPEVDYTGGDGLAPSWITDINHDGRNDLIFSNAARGNYAANSISVLINTPASSVTGVLTALPEPSNVTYPFTLKASLLPSNVGDTLSGNVAFSLDGTVVGSAAIVGNTASLNVDGTSLAAGSHSLSASWSGDSTYPALTLSGAHTISLLPLTVQLAATPNSVAAGSTVVVSVTLTPGILPNATPYQFTGALTLSDNGVTISQQPAAQTGNSFNLSSLAVGTHTLSVSYPGDSFFSAAQSNSVTVTVVGASTGTTLSATPLTSNYGTPVKLTATVSAVASSSATLPTGTVTFSVDGASLPPVPLTNSTANTSLNNLADGSHIVSCTYSGDTVYASSACNSVPLIVNSGPSVLTITSSQNPSVAYTPVTFTMHLTLGGQPAPAGTQLTFSLQSNSGNFILTTDANGNATYTTSQLSARTWDIVAIYAGGNYVSSVTHYPQVVTDAPTTLSLSASPNPAYFSQPVTLTAGTAPSGSNYPTGIVTFSEGATVLGTGTLNAAGKVSFSTSSLTVGTHNITASYAGDQGFAATASQPINVVILPADVVLTTDTSTLAIVTEHHGSMNVSLVSIGALSGTFTLSCGTLPAWARCTFGSASLALPPNGTASTTLEIDTDAVYHFKSSLERPSGPGQPSSKLPLLAFAPLAFFALRRKRGSALWNGLQRLAVLVLLVALGSLTGCGDKYPDHTEPGNYTVQITATSTPGSTPFAMTRTANFTLDVTP